MWRTSIRMTERARRVVVVGGTSGIGRATAEALVPHFDVVVAARYARDVPEQTSFVELDVSNEDSVASVLGSLDELAGLVFAAGQASRRAAPESFDRREFDQVMAVNVTGALLCLKHAVAALERGRGRVVWIGSLAKHQGSALSGIAYAASKAALSGAARQLALELAPRRIPLNVVHPGPTDTPMLAAALEVSGGAMPVPPTGEPLVPADTASVVRYLLVDAPVALTGAGIDMNGGMFRSA